jgi:FkbM family methyltransferase
MHGRVKAFVRSRVPRPLLLRYRATLARKAPLEAEMVLLPLLASNTGSFLDIGANLGTWSFHALKYFHKVYAFEPNEEMAAVLRKTLPHNVSVHAVALSDHEGNASFAIPLANGEELTTRGSLEPAANVGYPEVVRQVAITTLDKLGLRKVMVIKIDVEGHERAVIDGGAITIARERPVLIVEIEERHHPGQSTATFDRLRQWGYGSWFIRSDHLEMFAPSRLSELQPLSTALDARLRSANYVANFIFVPLERADLFESISQHFCSISASPP